MDKEQMESYRVRLQKMAGALEVEFEAMRGEAVPVSLDLPIGRLTRQEALQQQQMALEQKRRMELQRVQIETALGRIDAGTFGVCVLCKEPIDARRLEIIPESPICIGCHKKREARR